MQKKLLLLVVCVFMICISLSAQTTGRLAGRVVDDRGNPIEYANVVLQNTQIGAATDERGRFMIINITPGTYTVIVSSTGYTRHVEENVRISVDDTRTMNFTLQRASIEVEEFRVTAREQLIVRGSTTSGSSMSAEDISNVAVSDVSGLIALTAGVSRSASGEINVRGGRANEVVYTIDGMSVSDPVDGGAALSIDMGAIADMKVVTGGFTAEYGNAQSGMVTIVTKDGTERWEGRIEGITDHGHRIQKGSNMDELKFALGGPVPVYFFNNDLRSKFTFFLNGAGMWSDTRQRQHFKGSPWDDFHMWVEKKDEDGNVTSRQYRNLITATQYPMYNPYKGRSNVLGFDIGNRNTNSYNVNLKTAYQFNPMQKFTVAVRGDRSYWTPFSHEWRYALQHYAESESQQSQVLLTYDHVFDPKRNLQVKGSYFTTVTKRNPRGITKENYLIQDLTDFSPADYRFGFYTVGNNMYNIYDYQRPGEDPPFPDGAEWTYSIEGLTDPRNIGGFRAPGTIWDSFVDDESSQYNLRADFEYQHSQIVGMKTGFEIIQHDIKKNQTAGFLSWNENRFFNYLKINCIPASIDTLADGTVVEIYEPNDYFEAAKVSHGLSDGYKANPVQFAYYLQTKMDWEGMIVNLGLRMDLWYLGKDYDIWDDEKKEYKKHAFKSSETTQMMLSPRLGVSHPISERDVIHFAYNYQNQVPAMRYVFTTRDSLDAYSSGSVVVGNPALKPQITVTYEVGLQHLLTEDYVMGITAYYKNIYNYVSTRKVYSKEEDSISWYEYISEDYGSARGIDFSLNRRMFNYIAGGAAYSLSWANGNNSDTVIQDEKTSLREFPLDWDIRHDFNFNVVFMVRRGEEYLIPMTDWVVPFDDFSVSLNYNFATGRPYTPLSVDSNQQLETNSKRMPSTQRADLRFAKNFATGKSSFVRVQFTIENLFKYMNVNSVYGRTGSPYYDGADLSETGSLDPNFVYPETQFIHDMLTKDPSNVNNNRNYILSVGYNF